MAYITWWMVFAFSDKILRLQVLFKYSVYFWVQKNSKEVCNKQIN
jgi:hypothetical protein